ncbi:hypothetical protein HMPREF9630_00223 [Peptoanaerobacter stomatis]|uniref:Phage terminase, small subunit, P27 family n=1 Tax=Peptoanaerobacter stomatis TaxID=796937 RepID=V9HVS4_9FIRM|nr:phage terminase small subunit P27 family [Peptoanaerobacter stomatis]EHL18498.1 hypothetical protein HMPREF9630_00223 [Peptoanaerobacter stomatis]
MVNIAGRGRKSVSISKGKIGKAEIKRRYEEETKIKLNRDSLVAPEWLSDMAREEFTRVVTEAEAIGLLDNLDLAFLAIYAYAYSSYIEISQKINSSYITTKKVKKGKTQTTVEIINPLIVAQEKYIKQIMQCSTKLGLATTDRLKLIVPVKEEKETNKFLKFLK